MKSITATIEALNHNYCTQTSDILISVTCQTRKQYYTSIDFRNRSSRKMSTKTAKRKLPTKIAQPIVKQSAKIVGNSNLDESKTVVSGGGLAAGKLADVISISSGSGSDDGEEDSEVEDAQEPADVSMGDVAGDVDGADDNEDGSGEPTFGDLVRANASEVIDVAGAFEDPDFKALVYPTSIQPPSGASLGTVLTQALKTNDIALLESCLHTTDINTIRATIQRLDSTLAGTLLQKLAERLHKRPGRAGSLMVWVQWTLVTHGGYLATQPDLIKKLAGLNRVIEERAKGLTALLSLKGKLDMLEAQTELRRSMQNQRRRAEEDDNEDDVIYVEGQESEEESTMARSKKNGTLDALSDEDSDISEEMPNTNGIIAGSEDEEESSDEEGFLDDEAEETDADSGDEDEVDHDDQDSQDEESDDNEAPPSKLQRVAGAFAKKR